MAESRADIKASAVATASPSPHGSAGEVLRVALTLGCTAFGGPNAHLAYFARVYVEELQWLSMGEYAALLSTCHLLPGPTSSQVSFLVGLHRAGWRGALAAWLGFTFPAALLMFGFALLLPAAPGPLIQAVLHGLMLTAVAVVAQAVWNMVPTLAPDPPRRLIALAAGVALLLVDGRFVQLTMLAGGAIAGTFLCRPESGWPSTLPRRTDLRAACASLILFGVLLIGAFSAEVLLSRSPIVLASIFYRSGALVFGGGHVVLPLLQQGLVPGGWLTDDQFLAGYGLAQGIPGPLFTLAAYLGAISAPPGQSLLWALIALLSIFLPGLLLAAAGQTLLANLAGSDRAKSMLAGIGAAVVGMLAAALYHPVWTSAVRSYADVVVVLLALLALRWLRASPLLVTTICVAVSAASASWGTGWSVTEF